MRISFNFCNEESYDCRRGGTFFFAELSDSSFRALLRILQSYIEDCPDYHCRLKNDCGEAVYLCLRAEE